MFSIFVFPLFLAYARATPELKSLFINVNHAEGGRLILLSLVFHSEDHHFVSWEAVALLLGDLQYERDELLHMLLYINEEQIISIKLKS